MKIGIWISTYHFSAGGPSVVTLGLLIGIKQVFPKAEILINRPGNINIQLFGKDRHDSMFPKNTIFGPNPFPMDDVHLTTPAEESSVWKYCNNIVFSSIWVLDWTQQKFPLLEAIEKKTKLIGLWEAGVDTDFYKPSTTKEKTQDFFIYYKSQNGPEVEAIWAFLFHNYYGIKGTLMSYHFYSPEMLRAAAQNSRFCIVLDNEETQGLYALEIMSCDCPIFCIDQNNYTNGNIRMQGVTSITSWSDTCGMKSNRDNWMKDFPIFLRNMNTLGFTPSKFVNENYSFVESAKKLLAFSFPTYDENC
jgi:hypothetical protein